MWLVRMLQYRGYIKALLFIHSFIHGEPQVLFGDVNELTVNAAYSFNLHALNEIRYKNIVSCK
jgi:hypothetical protein